MGGASARQQQKPRKGKRTLGEPSGRQRQRPNKQVKKIIDTFIDKKGKNRKNIPCKDHFGVQHDYGNGLENQCRHRNDEGVECEGKT